MPVAVGVVLLLTDADGLLLSGGGGGREQTRIKLERARTINGLKKGFCAT